MKGIYCIENRIDGKKYYGSSMNIEKRLKMHRKGLLKSKHINIFLQRAVDKHGIENFDFKIVEIMNESTKKEILACEQKYIDSNIGGYNIAPANGGDILSSHPEREKILEYRASRYRDYLNSLTPEERKAKFGKAGDKNPIWKNGGRLKVCPICNTSKIEPFANTCGKCRNRKGKHNPFFGRSHTETTKKQLSEIHKNNSWIKDINPAELPYTEYYEIIYPDGTTKQVAGLKAIANEFNVSIANVYATIKRMSDGKIPVKSVFKNHMIRKIYNG